MCPLSRPVMGKCALHLLNLVVMFCGHVSRSLQGRRDLIVPHVSVQSIHQLNWVELASLGFKGCVLDKENTLTKPYSMTLEPGVSESLAACRAAFNGNLVVFSNSAGAPPPSFLAPKATKQMYFKLHAS